MLSNKTGGSNEHRGNYLHGSTTSSRYYGNEHITEGSNSYEKVKIFKYLGSLLTNQNSIQEKIKCRLKQETHVIIQSILH